MGKAIAAGIGVLVLIAALGFGAWHLGWFIEEANVNRSAEVNNDSFARQTALQEEIIDKYRTVADIDVQLSTATEDQKPALQAQRTAVLNQLCDAYFQSTGRVTIPSHITNYADRNCA